MKLSKKTILITLLQIIIVFLGLAVFVALLLEPQFEGKNAHATLFQIYVNDPFLAYIYLTSVPFFVGLYQAFKGLTYIKNNQLSPQITKMLKIIKYCALIIAVSTVAAMVYIKLAAQNNHDDPTGAVMLGAVITFASIIIAAIARILELKAKSSLN